jgi:hypothetical protein
MHSLRYHGYQQGTPFQGQCLFNIYDIAENYVKLLPTGDFNYWIIFNQNIWISASKELWKRHKKAKEIYYDALEGCEETCEKLDEMENTLENCQ